MIKNFQRIIIVGSSGSGKSYLSKRIAAITNLPLIHLDNEYWQPGWVEPPKSEWTAKQQCMVNKSEWIIEGNYNSTMEIRFQAADLVLFLDINRFTCIISAITRHGTKRSDLPDYLEEKFDASFFELLKWIWSFRSTGKQTIMQFHKKYPDVEFWHIKGRKAMHKMLVALETNQTG